MTPDEEEELGAVLVQMSGQIDSLVSVADLLVAATRRLALELESHNRRISELEERFN